MKYEKIILEMMSRVQNLEETVSEFGQRLVRLEGESDGYGAAEQDQFMISRIQNLEETVRELAQRLAPLEQGESDLDTDFEAGEQEKYTMSRIQNLEETVGELGQRLLLVENDEANDTYDAIGQEKFARSRARQRVMEKIQEQYPDYYIK